MPGVIGVVALGVAAAAPAVGMLVCWAPASPVAAVPANLDELSADAELMRELSPVVAPPAEVGMPLERLARDVRGAPVEPLAAEGRAVMPVPAPPLLPAPPAEPTKVPAVLEVLDDGLVASERKEVLLNLAGLASSPPELLSALELPFKDILQLEVSLLVAPGWVCSQSCRPEEHITNSLTCPAGDQVLKPFS